MGWIGVDLDGTLAEHYWPQKGPYEPTRIGDPIPAMVERVRGWLAEGREVRIFTARVGLIGSAPGFDNDDIDPIVHAIWEWTEKYVGHRLDATCMKDYKMIELWDDRAVRVVVNTGEPCCGLPMKALY